MTPSALLAYYCGDADMQCTTSPVAWDKTIDLAPWLPDWDTGWIPQSFPQLQIRLILKIPADTQVKLAGDFKTTWPEALTLATPGSRQSGFLKFDYGLILSGRYKIDVTVLGYNIYYEEAIPYFPQVDFHLLGMKQFDSWAFAPNTASASAFTPMIKVFDFSVTDLVGIPSQVGDAGIRLNIKGELEATYETAKMVVEPSVAPILGQNATTLDNFKGGSFVEYDVHPEGAVTFDGVIHLIPSLYVSVLGSDFDLPLYDYPISMGDLYSKVTGQPASFLVQDFKFDKVRVHVPLPNIEPLETKVVDFGKVAIGSGDKLKIPLPNHGEGKAKAYGEVNDADKSVFKVMTQTLYIDPCGSEDITVRFTPTTRICRSSRSSCEAKRWTARGRRIRRTTLAILFCRARTAGRWERRVAMTAAADAAWRTRT